MVWARAGEQDELLGGSLSTVGGSGGAGLPERRNKRHSSARALSLTMALAMALVSLSGSTCPLAACLSACVSAY